MVEILEDLARHSDSAIARIQAIKTLSGMEGDIGQDAGEFDRLDEVAAKRSTRRTKPPVA